MPFVHHVTPRLFDIDRAGVVFFATYFRFCQETLEEMLGQIFSRPLEEAFEQGDWLCPVVHCDADYRQPLRLGERCAIHLQVHAVADRTITFEYTICRADLTLCARLRTTHVALTPQTGRPTTLAPALRQGLVRLGLLRS